MKRTLFSLYIDIPLAECDYQYPLENDTISKTVRTKEIFEREHEKLVEVQKKYASTIGADYHIFYEDDAYQEFYDHYRTNYPEINTYSIVNFYKIHLLYQLKEQYDEILYLDLDVVPFTTESFFDAWDLTKGICVLNNNHNVNTRWDSITKLETGNRSPNGKFYNCQAMLIYQGYSPHNDVINTGIVGTNRQHLDQLDYFGDFKKTLDLMTVCAKNEDQMFPDNIAEMFAYDNETVFSYKLQITKTPVQWLDKKWHFFCSKVPYIPKSTALCHVINKKFKPVWAIYNEIHNL
jgi:hypothetical protein